MISIVTEMNFLYTRNKYIICLLINEWETNKEGNKRSVIGQPQYH